MCTSTQENNNSFWYAFIKLVHKVGSNWCSVYLFSVMFLVDSHLFHQKFLCIAYINLIQTNFGLLNLFGLNQMYSVSYFGQYLISWTVQFSFILYMFCYDLLDKFTFKCKVCKSSYNDIQCIMLCYVAPLLLCREW